MGKIPTVGEFVRRGASAAGDPRQAARELHAAIWHPDMEIAFFYCSPSWNLAELGAALREQFGDARLVGCTTAGEIGADGYTRGTIVGASLSSTHFQAETTKIADLHDFEFNRGEAAARGLRARLRRRCPDAPGSSCFGMMLIDGLSQREEAVVGATHRGLGDIQLVGGSAGGGLEFDSTHVYSDGQFLRDVAMLTLVHTDLPFRVFKTEHFDGSDTRVVVTRADPERRIVHELNGETAATEYARLVGVARDDIDAAVFAQSPVVVRVGGKYFVRSIMRCNPDGSLTFACAIDEGIVLTIASRRDIIEDIERCFAQLRAELGELSIVFAFDCVNRRVELERDARLEVCGSMLAGHEVFGFSTFGEQFNSLHVNQTLTGVAIGRVQ